MQQLASEVWSLQVRICSADGITLPRTRYEPTAFVDIWTRAQAGGGGDSSVTPRYQSVPTDLEWADVSTSPFLQRLRQASTGGLLSINFNVDRYNRNPGSPEFTRGRVVGTIGPSSAGEARHMVLGRHFMAVPSPSPGFFRPVGGVSFCTAIVDEAAGKVVLDLGNALPTDRLGSAPSDLGTLARMGNLWPLAFVAAPIVYGAVDQVRPRRLSGR